MELANALSFDLRPDEAIVSRTISMIPPDRREDPIIRQARERLAAERAAFLDGACAGDEALRQRLEARLAAHNQPETLLASQADTARPTIKLGMDTKRVVARFEAERQAVATRDHPNIAKVLDAGTTGVGRPYFAMELVRRRSRVDLRHRQQSLIDQGY